MVYNPIKLSFEKKITGKLIFSEFVSDCLLSVKLTKSEIFPLRFLSNRGGFLKLYYNKIIRRKLYIRTFSISSPNDFFYKFIISGLSGRFMSPLGWFSKSLFYSKLTRMKVVHNKWTSNFSS